MGDLFPRCQRAPYVSGRLEPYMEDAIVIFTPNPHDITLEEAEDVARAIRGLNTNRDVRVAGKEREGYGVTWFEVLHISFLGGAAFGLGKMVAEELAKRVTDIAVDWARERFKGRKSKSRRPVYVAIRGPDGQIIKSVVVKNATDDPEDRTESDRALFDRVRSNKPEP
jgi:hypothetical protein